MRPNRVRPKLVVLDAAAALDFYAKVLGADEVVRYDVEGRIVFAETEVFGTRITLKDADEHDPAPEGPGPILDVLAEDPDRVAGAIVEGGGTVIFEMSDQPFGGRWGRVRDPFGVQWLLHSDPTMSEDEVRDVLRDEP